MTSQVKVSASTFLSCFSHDDEDDDDNTPQLFKGGWLIPCPCHHQPKIGVQRSHSGQATLSCFPGRVSREASWLLACGQRLMSNLQAPKIMGCNHAAMDQSQGSRRWKLLYHLHIVFFSVATTNHLDDWVPHGLRNTPLNTSKYQLVVLSHNSIEFQNYILPTVPSFCNHEIPLSPWYPDKKKHAFRSVVSSSPWAGRILTPGLVWIGNVALISRKWEYDGMWHGGIMKIEWNHGASYVDLCWYVAEVTGIAPVIIQDMDDHSISSPSFETNMVTTGNPPVPLFRSTPGCWGCRSDWLRNIECLWMVMKNITIYQLFMNIWMVMKFWMIKLIPVTHQQTSMQFMYRFQYYLIFSWPLCGVLSQGTVATPAAPHVPAHPDQRPPGASVEQSWISWTMP